eukprot:TRINITY_DN4498_c0_g1_i2.p1 TRINITY_DN4498_c0_g1~~TRINITY_DN4498_c0_g1_i2.p1  ORF type:complete len:326 (+),score=24.71 TRINITY_DN4498_c0_g1_i2:22-999(+)
MEEKVAAGCATTIMLSVFLLCVWHTYRGGVPHSPGQRMANRTNSFSPEKGPTPIPLMRRPLAVNGMPAPIAQRVAASPSCANRTQLREVPFREWNTTQGRTILFARHAVSIGNLWRNRKRGKSVPPQKLPRDIPLATASSCHAFHIPKKLCVAEEQARKLGASVPNGLLDATEAIVVSALWRALATGAIAFGDTGKPLEVSHLCTEYRQPYEQSSWGVPVTELRRRAMQQYPRTRFNFSQLESVERSGKQWWSDTGPTAFFLQLQEFVRFIQSRKEKRLIVVSHGSFLRFLVQRRIPNAEAVLVEWPDTFCLVAGGKTFSANETI